MEDHGSINYWGLIANLQHGDVEPNIFGGVPVVARQPRGKKRPPLRGAQASAPLMQGGAIGRKG